MPALYSCAPQIPDSVVKAGQSGECSVRAGARQELTQPTQRLAKWFTTLSPKDKAKIIKDVSQLVLARRTRMCNFLEYKGPSHRVPHLRTNPQADGLRQRFKSCLPPLRFALFHRRLRIRRQ